MNKLVAGIVVIGFGAAVVVAGRPAPAARANIVTPGGFTFQMQPITLPSIQNVHIQVPVLQQRQPDAIVEHPVVAGTKVKPAVAVPASTMTQAQTQSQVAVSPYHSCSGSR